MTLQALLDRFPKHTRSGRQFVVQCPAHDDGTASLNIRETDDGKILLNCKAGCDTATILAQLGLTMRDLFSATDGPRRAKSIVAIYDYCDTAGALRYQTVRFDPKEFRQRRPNGQGWIWNLTGVERVLYRLPTLRDQPTVYIVEGEKDADRLAAHGLTATTNAGGAGKFTLAYCTQLTGAGVRHVVIIPDNDRPGRAHAAQVATSCHLAGLKVQILTLPDLPEKGDVSDFLLTHTPAEFEALARVAPVFPPVDAPDPEPAARPDPDVDLRTILTRLQTFIRRYMVLGDDQVAAVALWIAHTHVLEAFDCTPYLSVTSPVKRSGKTRLFEICEPLVRRPWLTGRVSAAVLVRKTDAEHPTLLLDESDAAFKMESEYSEALRGLLNTGYRRSGNASLCVGQGAKIGYRNFSTFGPKAIAGIGRLPDTVADRAIPIVLKRRTSREPVQRWRAREVKAEAAALKSALEQWAAAAKAELQAARPALPDILGDRQADVWEPLLAIADLAGGEWPGRARTTAVRLAKTAGTLDDDTIGLVLLEDIRDIFRAAKNPAVLHSQTLRERLHEVEDRPWGAYGRSQKPLTGAAMANLLKQFGVTSAGNIRIGERVGKGYRRAAFLDAWKRYLGRMKPLQGNKPNKSGPQSPIFDPLHSGKCSESKTANSSINTDICSGVADETRDTATGNPYGRF